MALTYKQSTLIRGSIPILKERGETITTLYYANLLRGHPELQAIFNPANQSSGRQPRALTAVILAFAANLHHTAELVPRLERVCNKHCSLGIKPEHYDLVGKYLLQAFAQVLGPQWTPDLHAAWTRAYTVLAKMLIGREAQLYREFAADTATVDSDVVSVRSTAPGAWTGWRAFRIQRKVDETPDAVSLYLYPTDGKKLPLFRPGQYISMRLDVPDPRVRSRQQLRQYSLSDAPRPDYYRITLKRDMGRLAIARENDVSSLHQNGNGNMNMNGNGNINMNGNSGLVGGGRLRRFHPGVVSNYIMDELWSGDVVDLSHPTGDFWVDEDALEAGRSLPLVLISAGIGAAPLMSILNASVAAVSPVSSRAGTPSSSGTAMRERPISWVHWSSSASSAPRKSIGPACFEEQVQEVAKSRMHMATQFFKSKVADLDDFEADADELDHELMALRMDLASLTEDSSRQPLHLNHGAALYYVCGPESFMEETARFLTERGVGQSRMKFEWFTVGDPAEKVSHLK